MPIITDVQNGYIDNIYIQLNILLNEQIINNYT